MIHFDYLAIAALSSILTAIPIVTGMLLLGAKHTTMARQRPLRPQPRPEPEPEKWQPEFYGEGYHWEPTADDGDPYSWKRVRDNEAVQR